MTRIHREHAAASVGEKVHCFYEELPFNFDGDSVAQASAVSSADQIAIYAPVRRFLAGHRNIRVLDAGCGAGWFANSVGHWYGRECVGLDFCEKALERARQTRALLGTGRYVSFMRADLFDIPSLFCAEFDLVNSLGVLHHTGDCFKALQAVVSAARPGGMVNIGLYHRYGRRPLLDMFADVRAGIAAAGDDEERRRIEEQGFLKWKGLQSARYAETFLRSWYRDQCLHPHETQWTLAEVLEWFARVRVRPAATSLNRFAPPRWDELVEEEKGLHLEAGEKLRAGRFYPGFFTVCGVKE